ncbi:MAG: diphosphate--fructose-6-phosphate 1-phosphotransferase [Bacteroidales bacterium]|jgi:pyrophosphate--fructose-6-phosphate 1-phosphotransferase|nr:diphosphate--fructose-6-phosphate 1-phosphotransferase [Bacteroidales bacterium]
MTISSLQQARAAYQPKLPVSLQGSVKVCVGAATQSVADQAKIKELFPNTYGLPLITFEAAGASQAAFPAINVGVILSGGQAPGGHNVISGLFDGLKKLNPASRLYGFLGGPSGLVDNKYVEITAEFLNPYRNTGGFDIIGSGRTKLEKEAQFDTGLANLKKLGITALVIIGGDDSNTNAALLAEYYAAKNAGVQVIGCPKTIDGDLKNEMIETSFGFDTAVKVYSELIGNIERDANSAKKYWHFIKLMGRSASHIALEAALQTQPNITLISEEVFAKAETLDEIVNYIADIVIERSKNGNNFGVALIPEGLLEFIPEIKKLISALNTLLAVDKDHPDSNPVVNELKATNDNDQKVEIVTRHLTIIEPELSAKFTSLPAAQRIQLILERDEHGNLPVSQIETEKLLGDLVKAKVKSKDRDVKFSVQYHFFGYEGRCAAPSNFDADYCYSLGYTASVLIANGSTGYMASVRNTTAPADKWIAGGIPITMMMNMEIRQGEEKPVIQKALVDLNGKPFAYFKEHRDTWAKETSYVYPGPIQYFGPTETCDRTTITLELEKGK